MNEAKDKSTEEKMRVFLAICRQFRPAFRYFFLETFSDPSAWVEARLAYTRGERGAQAGALLCCASYAVLCCAVPC
jgi:phosphatidylinositol kinase/protein kinase (PI-3  family)